MSKLTIHHWNGTRQEVSFVGYNRDHTACLIRDEKGARRAVALHLPKLFDVRFHGNPIAPKNSPAVEIKRVALHVPACFSSLAEKEARCNPQSSEAASAAAANMQWRVITRHKCWLESKDNDKLSELLRDELEDWRRRYVIREKETADQIAAVNQEIAALPRENTAHVLAFHQNRIKDLQDGLRSSFTTWDNTKHPLKFISIFDTTLDMARKGWGGLREKLLEAEWASHFGMNLDAVPTAAEVFHTWIEKHTYNARQTTHDMTTRTGEIGVGLKLDPWQWDVLEACVMHEVWFADGTRCWLDDIEERAVTDPQEIEDFDRLEGKAAKTVTQLGRERQKRQEGGAKTFKLVAHEPAAMELIRHMRDIRDAEIKAGRKHGAVKKAIADGREWWKRQHTDPKTQALLSERKVPDTTLRNWIEKTPLWLRGRRRKT